MPPVSVEAAATVRRRGSVLGCVLGSVVGHRRAVQLPPSAVPAYPPQGAFLLPRGVGPVQGLPRAALCLPPAADRVHVPQRRVGAPSATRGRNATHGYDPAMTHTVALVVTDGAPLFEVGVALEVFGHDRSATTGVAWYDLRVCAAEPGPVRLERWAVLEPDGGLEGVEDAGTVLVAPPADGRRDFPEPLLDALRRAHARGARIASICTGAFILAAAGLLEGRPAITHWRWVDELARRYPTVHVQRTVLYVDDGDVLTSAGSAAGLDLCLHLVRRDHGSRVAGIAARHTVVAPHREGGQAQYVPTPVPEPEAPPVAAALDWARDRLDRPVDVAGWARAAGTSPRTFARRFRDATGRTPLQWLATERVRRAQELLESTELPVEAVAARCGFATAAGLRKHFARQLGTTPHDYRRTFHVNGAGDAPEGGDSTAPGAPPGRRGSPSRAGPEPAQARSRSDARRAPFTGRAPGAVGG